MKVCKTCGQLLPLDQFHKDSKSKDKLNYSCKPCHLSYNRERKKIRRLEILNNPKSIKVKPVKKKMDITFLKLKPFNFNRDYKDTLNFLEKIGYDITGDIHEQFLNKVLMRSGVILKKGNRPKDILTKYFK